MSATKNPGSAMRHRVTLQQPVLTADTAGGYTRAWTNVATLWAQIEPMTQRAISNEKFVDERLAAITTHRITLRYYAGVTADMRLLYGSRIFNIVSVVNADERGVLLQILAKEGAGG